MNNDIFARERAEADRLDNIVDPREAQLRQIYDKAMAASDREDGPAFDAAQWEYLRLHEEMQAGKVSVRVV